MNPISLATILAILFDQPKITFIVVCNLVGVILILCAVVYLIVTTQLPNSVPSSQDHVESPQYSLGKLIVDVNGAVARPGMYELRVGQRVGDAIALAGSLSDKADTEYVTQELNLSRPLSDGDKIYVPYLPSRNNQEVVIDTFRNEPTDTSAGISGTDTGQVSVNEASMAQLDTIPGIGQKRAEAIISNRPYATLDELVTKQVLSENMLTDIKDYIKI